MVGRREGKRSEERRVGRRGVKRMKAGNGRFGRREVDERRVGRELAERREGGGAEGGGA